MFSSLVKWRFYWEYANQRGVTEVRYDIGFKSLAVKQFEIDNPTKHVLQADCLGDVVEVN